MIRIAEAIFGPLLLPECRRSVGRPWIIAMRTLAALAAGIVVLCVLWWWWFSLKIDPSYRPYDALHAGLTAIEGTAVVIAVLITPAVLAGSLAGEKERGTLGLLMTTRVNSWEIVTGRLGGKLAQVGMLLMAGAPIGLLLAELAGVGLPALSGMIALPTALSIGLGGISLAASAVSRRGRDALLSVYFAVFLVVPLILFGASSHSPEALELAAPLNPFHGVVPLVWRQDLIPACWSMLIWLIFGGMGLAVAAWRLRPSCLRLLSGDSHSPRSGRRRLVPPVNEARPMLWKEMFIERVSPMGRFGRWSGLLAGCLLVGVGLCYASLVAYSRLWNAPDGLAGEYAEWIGVAISGSATMVGYLIQLSVVLRAAVAISSERERGTWDGLLTSPMQGREIIVGKLCGSLFAMRWLILAALWAWTLALAFGAMPVKVYAFHLLGLFLIGACMSAIGVRVSLAMPTATKSMSLAVASWLILLAALSLLALVLVGAIVLTVQFVWMYSFYLYGPGPSSAFAWSPITFGDAWAISRLGLYVLLTVLVVIESRYRFDRIAGRMTGGAAEVSVDQFLHGTPMAPVLVDGA